MPDIVCGSPGIGGAIAMHGPPATIARLVLHKPPNAETVRSLPLEHSAGMQQFIGPFVLALPWMPLAAVILPCSSEMLMSDDMRISINFICAIGTVSGRALCGVMIEPFSMAVNLGGTAYEVMFADIAVGKADEFRQPVTVNE